MINEVRLFKVPSDCNLGRSEDEISPPRLPVIKSSDENLENVY